MRVLVTGANGFVGKNLTVRLGEIEGWSVVPFTRDHAAADLSALLGDVDAVVHLAGENRPADPADFATVNTGLTQQLCDAIAAQGRPIPLIHASSLQAERDNPYGLSKRGGEHAVEALSATIGNPTIVYRWPNVFGKWCKPNYNSAVATFCHNIARDLPIRVDDPAAPLTLVYVDDVVEEIVTRLRDGFAGFAFGEVDPTYITTVGAVADAIRAFAASRDTLVTERVGTGLTRALYATYVSYLPVERFAYAVPAHGDPRGVFVEMLKTPDSGQFSFFTAHPGITRGGHYHHTKTEKFLVIKGTGHFRFRHLLTGELAELTTDGDTPQIVETIPGWIHDITNVGAEEMVVMLWANEIFDRARPDTIQRSMA